MPSRRRSLSPRCRPWRPNKQSRDQPPTNDALQVGGSRKAEPIDARPPRQRGDVDSSVIVPSGGVWAPGGLHRLQSGRDGRPPSGGFDSRPPPPNDLVLCLAGAAWSHAEGTSPTKRVPELGAGVG